MISKIILFILLSGTLLIAQTPVGGLINGAVWTKANSPYLIISHTEIVDLTIEAGVTVLFNNDYKFEITGALQARGIYSDSIYFRANSGNPIGWRGISIYRNATPASNFEYCRVEGSYGSGIDIDTSVPPILSHCRFVNNSSNGIYIKKTQAQLNHCIIEQNGGNGINLNDGQIESQNSIIADNNNAGIFSSNSTDVINVTNSVIADNQQSGINSAFGFMVIKNSIVYDNNTEILSNPANTFITYSDVKGGYTGTGNINLLPAFVNREDYELSALSPCIDQGGIEGGFNDLYFPPSHGAARNDMGAYGGPQAGMWYPPLYVQPDSLDFGSVTIGTSQSINLTVKNYRDQIITVSELSFEEDSCNVFSVDTSSFSIAVLSSKQLLITFAPDTLKSFSAHLKLTTLNHGDVYVNLTGAGIAPHINLLKNNLDFGIIDLGHAWYLDLPIQNSGNDDLIINKIYSTDPVFTVNDTSFIIAPGDILNSLTVTFNPDSAKVYLDSLIIESNDPFQPRVAVPLWGEGRGPVIAVDQQLMDFGSVDIGSDTTLNITLSNMGNGNLDIEQIEILAGDSSSVSFMLASPTVVLPFYIDPDSSVILPIRFKPIAAGFDSAKIRIESNDPLRDTVYVDLIGKGLAPVIALSETSLDFGDVLVNSDSLQKLYIYNHGDAPLIIYKDSLVISGADSVFFIDPVLSDITIIPGDSVQLNVYFEIRERGVKQAELQIACNDPFHANLAVSLQGNGVAPVLHLSQSSIDFGTLSIGAVSQEIIYIHNLGDVELIVYLDSLSISGIDSAAFSIIGANSDIVVMPGDSADMKLRFKASHPGLHQANLYLSCNDPLQPNATVSLIGEGSGPVIDLSSLSIDFGSIPFNSFSVQDLKIYNFGNTDLIIYRDSLNITGTDSSLFSVNPLTADIVVLPEDSAQLSLRFDAFEGGSKSADLHIISNDFVQPEVVVSLSGVCLAANLQLSQNNLDFGTIPVNSDSLQKLYIYNTGDATLTVYHDSLNITGADANAFYIDQFVADINISPGDSADLNVGFTALTAGLKQAQLNISSNDPLRPNVIVNLSGAGSSAATIELLVNQLDFGVVSLGDSAELNLPIRNSGSDTLQIIQIDVTNASFTSNKQSFNIAPNGSSDTVLVKFKPDSEKVYLDSLIVFSNDPDHGRVAIPLIGNGGGVGPIISTDLASMNFGSVEVNSDSVKNLTISNLGSEALNIEQVQILSQGSVSISFMMADTNISFPFTINPSNNFVLPVCFKPVKNGTDTAQLQITNNDPARSTLYVDLSGNGIAPALALSQISLDFGSIPLNSDSTQKLTIYNTGHADLIIYKDSISISGIGSTCFSYDIPSADVTITPGDSAELNVRFTALEGGQKQAELQLKCNDPFQPAWSVSLTGNSIAPVMEVSLTTIDFGMVAVNSSASKQLYIYNTGLAPLIIYDDSLSITGSGSGSFFIDNVTADINILPGDSTYLSIRLNSAQSGQKEANLRIFCNDPLNPEKIVSLYGINFDSQPATIEFDQANSSNNFIAYQNINLSFSITSNSVVDSVKLYYRSGGKSVYTEKYFVRQGQTEYWEAQIDANQVTERGLEYYVCVFHGWTSTYWPVNGIQQPEVIQIEIPQMVFPQQTKREIYQKISIPFSTSGQTLNQLFGDNLGNYDDSKYRIFDCTNGIDYTEITNLNISLPPGKSVWLITKDQMNLDVSNGLSVSTDTDYTIQLRSGWNMIATPFAFPVAWVDVDTIHALRYYNGSDWPAVSILEPYKGYAVYTDQSMTISIPTKEAGHPNSLPKPVLFAEDDGWSIQIISEMEHLRDSYNFAGVHSRSSSFIDRFDFPEPPPIGDYLALYLIPENQSKRYSTDFRAPDEEGYIYSFELSTNLTGEKTIRFEEYNLPDQFDWVVISPETKVKYSADEFTTRNSHTFYQLIVGAEDFVSNATMGYDQLPTSFELSQNYPNPFNPSTIIKFQVPHQSKIDVNVFNILGQKIKTLLNDETKEAGYYQVQWDGTNELEQNAATGIYFMQLRTKDFNKTIKMILQR